MSILLSDEQREFQQTVRRFLQARYTDATLRDVVSAEDGLDPELWSAFTSMELHALGIPEASGGSGGTWIELGLVLEEMGYALVCSPYFATTLAAHALARAGGGEPNWMNAIRAGSLTATLAMPLDAREASEAPVRLTATRADGQWRLVGREPQVIDGHSADLLVVMAEGDEGPQLFAVERQQPGVQSCALATLDPTRKLAEVAFSDAVASRVGEALRDGWAGVSDLISLATLALAAEQLGGAQRALAMAVDYAKDRFQHGQAIGSFQAIKHRCADLLLAIEGARSVTYHALGLAAAGEDLSTAVRVAKAAGSDAFTAAAAGSIQIHGAIGFTEEHPAHLYLRRAKSSGLMFGSADDHRERIGQLLAEDADAIIPDGTILPVELEAEVGAFRTQVREFLRDNLPAGWQSVGALAEGEREAWLEDWRATLLANRMVTVAWPSEYGGGGRSIAEHAALLEEFARAGAPTGIATDSLSMNLLGPTILALASEEQKRHLVPRIVTGEDRWCQGYSEPEAGSDLASVKTHAVLRDGQWVINGQKIWTTSAHEANWMFALVRTDRTVSKHAGLTFLLIPLDQPGVDVRPILDINGHHHLNEVFFTDAVTDEANVLGSVNGGWSVATALLGYERNDAAIRDALNLRDELRRLTASAQARRALANPIIRWRLAQAFIDVQVIVHGAVRGLASVAQGKQPGPESSMHKLLWTEHHQRVTALALDVLGAEALTPTGRSSATHVNTDAVKAPDSSLSWVQTYFAARAGTIYAGTSEIQRNILGERVLGLPRGPKPSPAAKPSEPARTLQATAR